MRSFSLPVYLAIVFAISWPFQLFIYFFPEAQWAMKMLLVSMIMVSVGTYIASKYVFKDSLKNAGWHWGKPKHYIYAIILPLFLWIFPSILGLVFGLQLLPEKINGLDILISFMGSFLITLVPAFGEEFGWRGYLFPRLLERHSLKKALFIQAFIWWAWHLPFLVYSGLSASIIEGNPLLSVAVMLIISLIPSMMHAVVFTYFWSTSSSLAVATVYHALFDEVRDTLERSIGFGPLVELWQMVMLTIIGGILIWKGKWANFTAHSKAI